MLPESQGQVSRRFGVQGEEGQARSGAVETVHRVQRLTDLVAQRLEQKGTDPVPSMSVEQKTGGFVHRDQALVPMDDFDFGHQHCYIPRQGIDQARIGFRDGEVN